MKLFEYWTELPKVLSKLFRDNDMSYETQTSTVIDMANKILTTEKLIKQALKNGFFKKNSLTNTNSLDLANQVFNRLISVKKEKQLIAFECVKKSIKIMNSLIKSYESIERFDKEMIGKIKIFLQLTRSIAAKCDQEILILNKSFNKTNSKDLENRKNSNNSFECDRSSTDDSNSSSIDKEVEEKENEYNYENIDDDVSSDLSCYSDDEKDNNSNKDRLIENKRQFILMIKTYVIKLQAKLYEKTSRILSTVNIFNNVQCDTEEYNKVKVVRLTNEKRTLDTKDDVNSSRINSLSSVSTSYTKISNNDRKIIEASNMELNLVEN